MSGVRQVRGADVFRPTEGNTGSVDIARHTPTPLVVDPGMRRSLLHGNREISIAVPASRGRDVSGRPEAVADDECEGEVGPARGSVEASEQSGLGSGGARGAKGQGQGECGTAKHGPDAEPETVSQAQARIREAVIRNRQGLSGILCVRP